MVFRVDSGRHRNDVSRRKVQPKKGVMDASAYNACVGTPVRAGTSGLKPLLGTGLRPDRSPPAGVSHAPPCGVGHRGS